MNGPSTDGGRVQRPVVDDDPLPVFRFSPRDHQVLIPGTKDDSRDPGRDFSDLREGV
jgi:hypothetical protein